MNLFGLLPRFINNQLLITPGTNIMPSQYVISIKLLYLIGHKLIKHPHVYSNRNVHRNGSGKLKIVAEIAMKL